MKRFKIKLLLFLILSLLTVLLPSSRAIAQTTTYEFVTCNTTVEFPDGGSYCVRSSEGDLFFAKQSVNPPSDVFFVVDAGGQCSLAIYGVSKTNIPNSSIGGTLFNGDCNGANGTTDFAALTDGTKTSITIAQLNSGVTETDPDNTLTCESQGGPFGWAVCPVLEGMLSAAESIAEGLGTLLRVRPLTDSSQDPVYRVWQASRNVALALLVIGALIAIFSQALSLNAGGYTAKRLIPRIGIVAIGITLSYWIAALIIDAFNIIGGGMLSIMYSAVDGLSINPDVAAAATANITILLGLIAGAGIIAYNPAILYSLFLVVLPFLLALITAFIVIVLRQVLIIALVIAAPLAIVGWLLPNTEWTFKRWYSLFGSLLIMYPLIMVLLGAANIFVYLLIGGAVTSNFTPNTDGFWSNFGNYVLALVAVGGVLIAIPFTLKASSSLLSRLAGIVNDPNKGLFDRMRRGAEARRDFNKERSRENTRANRANNPDMSKFKRGLSRFRTGDFGYGAPWGPEKGLGALQEAEATRGALTTEQKKGLLAKEAVDKQKGIEYSLLQNQIKGMNVDSANQTLKAAYEDQGATFSKKAAALELMADRVAYPELNQSINDTIASAQQTGDKKKLEDLNSIIQGNFGKFDSIIPQITRASLFDAAGGINKDFQPNWSAAATFRGDKQSSTNADALVDTVKVLSTSSRPEDLSRLSGMISEYQGVIPERRDPKVVRAMSDAMAIRKSDLGSSFVDQATKSFGLPGMGSEFIDKEVVDRNGVVITDSQQKIQARKEQVVSAAEQLRAQVSDPTRIFVPKIDEINKEDLNKYESIYSSTAAPREVQLGATVISSPDANTDLISTEEQAQTMRTTRRGTMGSYGQPQGRHTESAQNILRPGTPSVTTIAEGRLENFNDEGMPRTVRFGDTESPIIIQQGRMTTTNPAGEEVQLIYSDRINPSTGMVNLGGGIQAPVRQAPDGSSVVNVEGQGDVKIMSIRPTEGGQAVVERIVPTIQPVGPVSFTEAPQGEFIEDPTRSVVNIAGRSFTAERTPSGSVEFTDEAGSRNIVVNQEAIDPQGTVRVGGQSLPIIEKPGGGYAINTIDESGNNVLKGIVAYRERVTPETGAVQRQIVEIVSETPTTSSSSTNFSSADTSQSSTSPQPQTRKVSDSQQEQVNENIVNRQSTEQTETIEQVSGGRHINTEARTSERPSVSQDRGRHLRDENENPMAGDIVNPNNQASLPPPEEPEDNEDNR